MRTASMTASGPWEVEKSSETILATSIANKTVQTIASLMEVSRTKAWKTRKVIPRSSPLKKSRRSPNCYFVSKHGFDFHRISSGVLSANDWSSSNHVPLRRFRHAGHERNPRNAFPTSSARSPGILSIMDFTVQWTIPFE